MTQKERIQELEDKLAHAKENTYVRDITNISAANNELCIQYGDDDNLLVLDIDSLFPDLSLIVTLTARERDKTENENYERLKESLDKL
jgi:hypothetical protein